MSIFKGCYVFEKLQNSLKQIKRSLLSRKPDLDYLDQQDLSRFSEQDIVGLLIAGVMGALYYLSAEEELDWEALLGDDDDDDDEEE